jgi:hypothetical protein
MFIEQLVNLLDKSPWQLDNPGWVKQRKKDWTILSKTLRAMDIFNPKDVRYYKSYFLTGELMAIKDELKDTPQHANYVILLMLHPIQTEENLKVLYKQFQEFRTLKYDDESRCADVKFFSYWVVPAQNKFFKGDEPGIFNGLEKVYCHLLYGESNKEFEAISWGNDHAFEGYCHKLVFFLLDGDSYLNTIQQYLTDFSFYLCAKTDFDFGAVPVYVGQFLQVVYYYELLDPFKDIDKVRYDKAWTVVNAARQKLEGTELPDKLKNIWELTKSEKGKETKYRYFLKRLPVLEKI